MASLSPLDLALRMIALTGSGVLTGAIAIISHAMIPTTLLAPSALAQAQFRSIFNYGKLAALSIAGITSLSYATLAYRESSNPRAPSTLHQQQPLLSTTAMYAAAGALTISILPYTLTMMGATNNELLGPATPKGDGVRVLLERWARLNYGRSVITLVGTMLGMVASLR